MKDVVCRVLRIVFLLAACSFPVRPARAASLTWDGAESSNWNTSDTNWSGTATWNNATPDSAVFGDTGVGTVSLTEAITAGAVEFSNTAGNNYVFNTSSLTANSMVITGGGGKGHVTFNNNLLGNFSVTVWNTGAAYLMLNGDNAINNVTLEELGNVRAGSNLAFGTGGQVQMSKNTELELRNGVTIDSGVTWRVDNTQGTKTMRVFDTAGADSATWAGNVDINEKDDSQTVLSADSGNSLTIGGIISDSRAPANASVNRVLLSGGGTFTFESDNTFRGGTIVADGGTLNLGSGGTAGSAGVEGGAANGTGAGTTGAGNIVLSDAGSTLTINRSNALNIGGIISGSGKVNQISSGTTTLSGVNTYSGATSINNGTLVVSGGAAIANAGTVVLADVSGATLRLDANETIGMLTGGGSTGGTVDLQANTLTISQSGTGSFGGAITGSGGISVASGGRLDLSGTSSSVDIAVQSGGAVGGAGGTTGKTTFSGGAIYVNPSAAAAFSTVDLDISGGIVPKLDGTISSLPVDIISYTGTLTGDPATDVDLSSIAARGATVVDSAGTIQITSITTAARTWSGAAGQNWDIGTTASWVEGDQVFQNLDDATFGDTGAGTVTLTEAITAGAVTFTGGAYTFDASSGSLSFNTLDTTGATSVGFDGVLAGSGTITSAVGGSWINNNSAFSGTVNHSAGTVFIDSANSLGTGTFNLSGGVLKSQNQSILNSTLVVNATGGRISADGVNNQTRFSGVVNFNSGGTGVQIGGDINNRTMAFESGATLGGNAASVTIGRSTTFIRSGVYLTYTGNFNIERTGPGASVLDLGDGIDLTTNTNNINFNGSMSDQARAVQVNDGGTATLKNITQNETTAGLAQLLTANGSTLYVSGVISGQDITIAGDGTGTTVFTGDNTYSGATAIDNGTLLINGNQSGATGNVTVNAGATLGGDGNIGGVTEVNGKHTPGDGIGLPTFVNDLNYNAGANVVWQLGANSLDNRGTNFDGVDVWGNLNFDPTVTLELVFNDSGSTVDWRSEFWEGDHQWLIWDVGGTTDTNGLALTASDWPDSMGAPFNTELPESSFAITQTGENVYLSYYAPPPPHGTLFIIR